MLSLLTSRYVTVPILQFLAHNDIQPDVEEEEELRESEVDEDKEELPMPGAFPGAPAWPNAQGETPPFVPFRVGYPGRGGAPRYHTMGGMYKGRAQER